MAQQAAKEKANSFMPSMVKGKQKEESTEQKIRIGLWRASSGRHVWDADVAGSVLLSMAWSLDGLYLSVIVEFTYNDLSEELGLKLLHLSVQDGSLVHDVPLVVDASRITNLGKLDMDWCESGAEWPQDAVSKSHLTVASRDSNSSAEVKILPQKGSAAMIIDSLPQPNDIEHFEIAENNPMMAYNKKKVAVKNPNETHALLRTFPSLLDSQPPHVLCIPALSRSFLSGTFPLTSHRSLSFQHKGFTARLQKPILREDMLFAKSGTRLRIMEELTERLDDLESCAADNGTSRDAVMADLLRLLVAGRCGDAVSQFMGGKLTDGALNKWMSAYDDSVEYIHQTLSYGVFPALERLILLLEELKGWSMYKRGYDLNLETSDVEECIEWARYLAIRVMDMSRDVTHEAEAFREFGKWLKYEISRATMQDAEDLAEAQTPKHNVAFVAAYLDMLAEKGSTLPDYFLVDSERLAGHWAAPQLPTENDSRRPLPVVLKELMITLRGTSEDLSDLEIDLPDPGDGDAFPLDTKSTIREKSLDQRGDRPQDDVRAQPNPNNVTPKEPGKDPLWSIADVLLSKAEKLVIAAIKDRTLAEIDDVRQSSCKKEELRACRTAETGLTYEALRSEQNHQVIHVHASSPEVSSFYTRTFRTGENTHILNFDFFDDEQLVIVLQLNEADSGPGVIYMTTISLADLQLREGEMYESSGPTNWPGVIRDEDQDVDLDSLPYLPVSQSRRIGAVRSNDGRLASAFLALNGRKGRRFACVGLQTNVILEHSGEQIGTKDVMIFDMDENEGIEEEVGDESEQQGDQTGEQQEDRSADRMDVDE
ncbi:hypothetical protein QFC22_002712 [Naganishia vaughanmartiniae]|uniref:Uncharacterized protein n=1 Tax=Naganishia vaughanmartiniae TaxID=1424756 RepID=A0ACC2XBM9_9TREE|nr:hypothetical protein QFC22_002712 [Naganishia vaughanmartiniae]